MLSRFCSEARRYGSAALFFGVLAGAAPLLSGCGGPKPIATVNGQTLSEAEFGKLCADSTGAQQQQGTVGLQVLQQWIVTSVASQVAKDQKVYPSDEELKSSLETMRKMMTPPGMTFDQYLAERGGTMDAVRRNELSRMVTQRVLFRGVNVTDDEVRKAFDSQKAALTQPEQVEISMITVDSEKAMKDAQADLNAGGVFANVATSRSKDIFRQNGGKIPMPLTQQLPPQLQGKIPQEALTTAFKLKTGQTSDPVKVGQTWIFVHVDNKIDKKDPNFDDFKGPIREQMVQQKAQQSGKLQENQRILMEAVQKAKLEIYPPQYQVLAKRIAAGPGGGAAGSAPGAPAAGDGPPPAPPGR